MKFYLLSIVLLLGTILPANASRSPEQQIREFVFSLHDNGNLGAALQNLCKDSPAYASHPDRVQETTTAIDRVLSDFGPVEFSRLLKKEDLAPVLVRLTLVSDTAKGPIFWAALFYRKDPNAEDWSIISIRVSASADDIVR